MPFSMPMKKKNLQLSEQQWKLGIGYILLTMLPENCFNQLSAEDSSYYQIIYLHLNKGLQDYQHQK